MGTGEEATRGDVLAVPNDAQVAAWSTVRARLALDADFLTAALFHTVPVVVDTTHPGVDDDAPAVTADRWGRVYLTAQTWIQLTEGGPAAIKALSPSVGEAVLAWCADTTEEQEWFADLTDERFPAVAAVETARVAHRLATSMLNSPSLQDWCTPFTEWARTEAGVPTVPWRQRLGACVRAAVGSRPGRGRQTYTRPTRRPNPHIVVPARRANRLDLTLIIDRSGSVSDMIPLLAAEVTHIVRALGTTLGHATLICVDDEVSHTRELDTRTGHVDYDEISPRPGHLTDLRAGFDEAAKQHRRRGVTVVLTDGFTAWPETPPAGPVVVVLVGEPRSTAKALPQVPRWAGVVQIDVADLAGPAELDRTPH